MQTILLIHHAKAEQRGMWTKADHLRPLTPAGHKQAQAIANELGAVPIAQIRSSPAVRCVQTVDPLAARARIKLHLDQSLAGDKAIALPAANRNGLHIFCTDGERITALLDELGIECEACQRGSIWMLKRNDQGAITEVSYVKPSSGR